ncbi:MAG TPA: hypothetical protein VGO41_08465 [Steroidobacteraceae bacterium]|jgi:hypothetical protein|nr:hypothetical protein [Steroidobacteraceae bacterium]
MKLHSGLFAVLATALLLPVGATAADQPQPTSAAAAKSAKDERQCSMPTSPRLQKKGDECEQAKERTRSHSNEELNSTGQSTADALRRLNPTVR